MPVISPDHRYLTVINLFSTDTSARQLQLLSAMREIVDAAAYPGWISSTVHSGQDRIGTANFIQWRSKNDLKVRYAGEEFRHRTVPLFTEITTSIKLLQTEVAFCQRHPSLGDRTVIGPERDDYTVIELFGATDNDLDDLVDTLGPAREWLPEVPGYRSHSVLRGVGSMYFEGPFAVCYSQWEDKKFFDDFRTSPPEGQPIARRKIQARLDSLATFSEWNSYRVVHTRSAPQQASRQAT
jgi:heme-degrading monooxygenase HmoA